MKKTTGKKVYGVAAIDQKEYVKAAGENSSSSAVHRDLLNVRGKNATILNGTFELPDIRETKDSSVEFAVRVLGMLVTKDLLTHLPSEVTAETLGTLVPFYPLSYHRRFGTTYTDRICPESTRTGKCKMCKGRAELFGSEAYKSGKVTKDAIMGAGFGTRQIALVIGRFYYNDEDLGVRAWWTPLTNEKIATARHDKFFDKVAELASPKKLSGAETLPRDYYSNGDGARWLFVEYKRELYSGNDDKAAPGTNKQSRGPSPFWQLKSVTCAKELPGVGKAEDIWWPEIDGKDAVELVDIYDLIDHSPEEEIEAAVKEATERVLNPKRKDDDTKKEEEKVAYSEWDGPAPTWQELNDMDAGELVGVGAAFGGDPEELSLVGKANETLLRRNVAKLCGAKPTPVTKAAQATANDADSDPAPF